MGGNREADAILDEDSEQRRNESDLQRMHRVVRNEKAAPEILHYENALVEGLCASIERMEDSIMTWQDSPEEVQAGRLKAAIHWRDVNRAKYLLRAYLRTRLTKIEAHSMCYAMTERQFEKLSESEQEFLTRYINATERLMQEGVLKGFPQKYQSLVNQVGDDGDQDEGSSFDMGAPPSHLIIIASRP